MGAMGWRPGDALTQAEQVMRHGAEAGTLVDGGRSSCDFAAMQAWGPGRTVRAAVLQDLLLGNASPLHNRGVQLRGLRIIGQLDIQHANLQYPLLLDCCYLPDGVAVTGATVALFAMKDCWVAGLGGDALVVSQFLDFGGSTFSGPVRLMLAEIGGGLSFRGCHLSNPGDDGVVLWAERLRVDGDAFLDKDLGQRPFVADGGLRLSGATIAGNLSCVGAQLRSANRDAPSLMAQRIRVGGDVFLTSHPRETGFGAKGTINLIAAEIVGALDCSGASLGGDARQDALTGAGMKVGSGILLNSGFSAAGAIELRGAEIAANLVCRDGTQLNGVNADGCALSASGIHIGGHLQIFEGFKAAGEIFLGDAEVSGDVMILGAQLNSAKASSMSIAGSGMTIGGAMVLGDGLTAAGAIDLRGAKIAANLLFRGGAKLDGANTEGNSLQADGLKVGGNLFVRGNFTSDGAIDLVDAEIGGNLECRGTHLSGSNRKGSAMHAERITVGSQVYLDQGFRADGAIYLLGAHIKGNLECRGAHIRSQNNGPAMYAERMRVDGDVYLDSYSSQRRFIAIGTVYLLKAEIGGVLSCRGAQLNASNASRPSMFAERMAVGGNVYLNEGFSASGCIDLNAATIGGSLEIAPDRLQQDKRLCAINAANMRVSGRLRWMPETQIQGRVSLEGAAIGHLEDSWTEPNGERRANGYWPDGGRLRLEGLTYSGLAGPGQPDVKQRLHWIRSQYKPRLPEPWEGPGASPGKANASESHFSTQPYQQLVRTYQQVGKDAEARATAIAMRRDRRKRGHLTWYRKVFDWLLDFFIGYGYQTWRVVAALVSLFGIVFILTVVAEHNNAFEAAQNATLLHPVPSATKCENDYPCFSPLGFTIDTVIPLIDVHQADYWAPNAETTWGAAYEYIAYTGTAFGWFFATLALAGATGIVRRLDPS